MLVIHARRLVILEISVLLHHQEIQRRVVDTHARVVRVVS